MPLNPFRLPSSALPSRNFLRPSAGGFRPNKVGAWYRRNMEKHPFLLFGFPFLTMVVAGSFVITPATAIRYDRHDRRVQQLTREQELDLGWGGDMKADLDQLSGNRSADESDNSTQAAKGRRRKARKVVSAQEEYARLAGIKDVGDWDGENKRVKRLKGEPDGRIV